ncbi:hypothetical protein BU23DRAFT_301053 [Bimuria novae-zelandiae CBS 107.79]|uniref:Uncharacterized protein n=1 Tax=Bimuria novae-zelandiae CBS 107.79 TaxID=1447943 RepID=A0A6A5V1L4_9PLEO|nr:hypothetical protein BU23DRAFT_301053 [Bimuria novae-zelandiae CBS 107.79]
MLRLLLSCTRRVRVSSSHGSVANSTCIFFSILPFPWSNRILSHLNHIAIFFFRLCYNQVRFARRMRPSRRQSVACENTSRSSYCPFRRETRMPNHFSKGPCIHAIVRARPETQALFPLRPSGSSAIKGFSNISGMLTASIISPRSIPKALVG